MLQPGRHANTSDYRYGFQGQEMDDEIKGEGNSLNYTFRMHDPRLGRFSARDPLERDYPMLTPYQFASNSLIAKAEIEGLEGGWVIRGEKVVYEDGPVTGAFDSEAAAKASINQSNQITRVSTPAIPGGHMLSQENRTAAQRKSDFRKGEGARLDAQLMQQTYSNPGVQIAHGVYVGIPEGVMEVSGMMVTDKVVDAYKAYRAYRKSKLATKVVQKLDNFPQPEFIDNGIRSNLDLQLPKPPVEFATTRITSVDEINDIVKASKANYGGNVTVMKDGVPVFRVHQPGTHGNTNATLTRFRQGQINPATGRAQNVADKRVSPIKQEDVDMLNNAIDGKDGLSITTKGG